MARCPPEELATLGTVYISLLSPPLQERALLGGPNKEEEEEEEEEEEAKCM